MSDSGRIRANGDILSIDGGNYPNGIIISNNIIGLSQKFREVDNGIEGKVWFELDVSHADTIVIIHEGKRVEMDKKAFLQAIGLEW
ncbi:hypothetical protein LCGC14_2433470 [marine sediment metagenome]|uniref:Uncharacterized protein n=1 Tax=marine sediment metagenome TaxID=412755 RepID=A0A0F9BL83_9ZZZZ